MRVLTGQTDEGIGHTTGTTEGELGWSVVGRLTGGEQMGKLCRENGVGCELNWKG